MNPFEIKKLLDNYIYRGYNFVSNIFFYFKFHLKYLIKENSKYKDLHKNERCFILATGPSINKLENHHIDLLKKELVLAVNSFYKIELTESITPDYYVLLDDLYWKDWSYVFSDIEKKYKEKAPVFITDFRSKPFLKSCNEKSNSIFLHAKKYPVDYIDSDLSKNMFIGMNVVATSILSAIYFGVKDIYLIGADYNAFCSQGKGHAYDDDGELSQSDYNLAFYLKFYAIGTEFHYLIAKYAKKKGVRIINLNPNSLLDAYPKIPLNEILG
jgi:hypothetical protein